MWALNGPAVTPDPAAEDEDEETLWKAQPRISCSRKLKNKDWKNEHWVGPQTEKMLWGCLSLIWLQIHKTHYILNCTFLFFSCCQLSTGCFLIGVSGSSRISADCLQWRLYGTNSSPKNHNEVHSRQVKAACGGHWGPLCAGWSRLFDNECHRGSSAVLAPLYVACRLFVSCVVWKVGVWRVILWLWHDVSLYIYTRGRWQFVLCFNRQTVGQHLNLGSEAEATGFVIKGVPVPWKELC